MIEILFPPGCYGTYLARSIYNYTSLRAGDYHNFTFDSTGSSHIHRQNLDSKFKIIHGHLPRPNYITPLTFSNVEKIITILPLTSHNLDYCNNQYFKESKGSLINYIKLQLPISEINQKLNDGWGAYTDALTDTTPQWVLREFFSLWIAEWFINGYSAKEYSEILSKIKINTQDIITNIEQTITDICYAFNLTINVTTKDILLNHQNFLIVQRYHNSQLKCDHWVDATINSSMSIDNPCQTIFDEAYVQHLFRTRGYEIKCDGLNIMPSTSTEMKKIIYKI